MERHFPERAIRIMLVEDDLQLGAALHRAFELNSFESVWVRRLKDARGLVTHAGSTLIVLDLGLPDGEGIKLLELIRSRANDIPVIILTARDSLEDRVRGLNTGADDYVTKPVAVAELIARIRAVSRRAAGFSTNRWELGDLRIDLDTHTVCVGDAETPLTPSEFKLLIELARHSGRVISREALISALWGATTDGSDSALDYQVHGLRKKIGSHRVATVRGVGFRMADT